MRTTSSPLIAPCESTEFGHAVAHLRPALLGYARRLHRGDTDAAEDLVQDTLLRALENAHLFQPGEGSNLAAWLHTIQLRLFCTQQVQHQRKHGRCVPLEYFVGNNGVLSVHQQFTGAALNDAELQLQVSDLMEQIKTLPRELELVIRFRALGYKYDELAMLLQQPVGTIKAHLHQARCMLEGTTRYSRRLANEGARRAAKTTAETVA